MSETDAPGGRLLGGRYRLIERIGSGPTSTVWRAFDETGGRHVAVKEPLLPGDPADEDRLRAANRLYREARAAARVDDPAAVAIHDVLVEGGLPWIVMELVRGESLHTTLAQGPLPASEAARVGLAVLGALRAAHAVGIVHRDLKPANVLVESGTGRVVLTDFGIGHPQGEGPHGDPGEPGAGGGAPGDDLDFMAPERLVERGAGPAADLWSLGALLRAAVEGRPPVAPEDTGPLGPLLDRLLLPEPSQRPGPEEVAAVLTTIAGPEREPLAPAAVPL
ncbi:serine/threonine-protein kinase [Streptomyces sp. NPDC026672]|uniref:serine/threonine-protein kinase n=1 Tax=unclassified Streptomyces TaxID=2593676 RepID=UPI0033D2106D